MKKYAQSRTDFAGNGEAFARHLLHQLGLDESVNVEIVKAGDHYDPIAKAVRLSQKFSQQTSLTAIVIAAHEVGHVIQDFEQLSLFKKRILLAKIMQFIQYIAPITLTVAPILLFFTKSILLSGFVVGIGFLSIAMNTLFHLITLPVEWDASFNKALPILVGGEYLTKEEDIKAAHTILKAAALTYVSQSLFNLLNIAYWLRLLKR